MNRRVGSWKYAATHQFGRDNIPARPYLWDGLNNSTFNRIRKAVQRAIPDDHYCTQCAHYTEAGAKECSGLFLEDRGLLKRLTPEDLGVFLPAHYTEPSRYIICTECRTEYPLTRDQLGREVSILNGRCLAYVVPARESMKGVEQIVGQCRCAHRHCDCGEGVHEAKRIEADECGFCHAPCVEGEDWFQPDGERRSIFFRMDAAHNNCVEQWERERA